MGEVPKNIHKALGFIPKEVDKAIIAAIDKIAARVATVAGATAPAGLFRGAMGKLAPFDYAGKHYVLWVAEEVAGTRTYVVKIAENVGGTYKFVNSLRQKDFEVGHQQNFGDLINAAMMTQGAVKVTNNAANKTKMVADACAQQVVLNAAELAVIADIKADACKALNAGCFAAGTGLWTPHGYWGVESFRPGDVVYARSEFDPAGKVEVKAVEEVFVRYAGILALHAGGQVVRTTGEHPFYERAKGWTACHELRPGDTIAAADGTWVAVDEVWDTGDWEPVYNLREADHHTYFVGDAEWPFALWAHNTYTADRAAAGNRFSHGSYRTVHNSGDSSRPYSKEWFIPHGTSPTEIDRAAAVDSKYGIGDRLQAQAQVFASNWKNLDEDGRYRNNLPGISAALERVNVFLRDAGLAELTLDGIDRGTQVMTMPNATAEFRAAVNAFYQRRGKNMGTTIHLQMKEFYQVPANQIAGLTYHGSGPDFQFEETPGGPVTYFEVLTRTKNSRQTHNDRHGGNLWRTVYYTFGAAAAGQDVSDIE